MRRGADLTAEFFVAVDFVVARFSVDFLAGCFFAVDFAATDAFFAGLREAVFFGRAGAIGSLHLDYQMYQMRVRVEQLSLLWPQISVVGCVIVPTGIF